MDGDQPEPETNMDPVKEKAEEPEQKGTGSTVELTGGMNVVKDTNLRRQRLTGTLQRLCHI